MLALINLAMIFRPILVFICIVALSEVQSGAVLPELSHYNPLNEESFTVKGEWKHYTSPRTNVVGSAVDLMNGDTCQRVIVFSAHGVVFDYYRIDCDIFDPRLGLLEAFGALWYYKEVLAREESDKKYIILFKGEGRTCNKKTYTINDGSPQVSVKTEPSVNIKDDPDCNMLAYFIQPMMKFLSSQSTIGKTTSMTDWSLFNIWEPLGAMTRLYKIKKKKLFRFLVLTSYGRVIDKLKVSGGPIQGLVLKDQTLYYGNVVMVKAHGGNMNTFTILYNPNTGVCIRRTITLSSSNEWSRTKPEHIQESDPECQGLIKRNIPGASVSEVELGELRKKLADGSIDVKPFANGLSVEGTRKMPTGNDINLNQGLGAVFFTYKPTNGERICQVIVTAKGVPLAGILKENDPSNIVAREDHLYYDRDIMVKKGADDNYFIVITRLNTDSCSEKTYILRNEDGKMVKEEKQEVNQTKDNQECNNLIEGNELKNSEADKYLSVTDENDVITSVETNVQTDETDVDNKDL